MPPVHAAAVWLDHTEAKVFALSREGSEEWKVRPHDRHPHLHHKAGLGNDGRATADPHYFHSVADALKDAGEVLIVGPGMAKKELMHHLSQHDPEVASRIVAVESMDHPSDGEIIRYARKFFRAADRMR